MARYDFQDTSGYAPDDSVVPALVNAPTIFIAPSARTVSSGELWMAVSCSDINYGGCYIWASNDGSHYERIGKLYGSSIHGALTANLAAASGLDITNTLAIDISPSGRTLESVNQASVDVLDSLCYVGGEFLAFKTATNTGAGLYSLSYLKRGLYGSTPGALSGADFVGVDDTLFRYRFNKSLVGRTLYLKFQGFNLVESGVQDIAGLAAYSVAITGDGGVKALLSDLPVYSAGTNITISGGVISAVVQLILNEQMTGTVPTLVGSVRLAAGTYPAPSAQVGAGNPLKIATLELRKSDGTALCTIGGTPGGLTWRTANAGFTLTTTTDVDLVLYCNAALEPAVIKGFTF